MTRAPWTPAEDARLAAELAAGAKQYELVERLGRSRSAINRRAQKLGLICPPDLWLPEEDEALRAALANGATYAGAARMLGRSTLGVQGRARRMDLSPVRCGRPDPYSDAELSREKIAAACAAHLADLHRAHGVSA